VTIGTDVVPETPVNILLTADSQRKFYQQNMLSILGILYKFLYVHADIP
jgi:hypothetical protein